MTATTTANGDGALFCRYILSSLDRLMACLDSLDERQMNGRPPADNANSVYALTTHTLGIAEENIHDSPALVSAPDSRAILRGTTATGRTGPRCCSRRTKSMACHTRRFASQHVSLIPTHSSGSSVGSDRMPPPSRPPSLGGSWEE